MPARLHAGSGIGSILMSCVLLLTLILTVGCEDMVSLKVNVAPNWVGDLRVTDSTAVSIKLKWTAPVDHDGRATLYEIRYSTSLAEMQSWTTATLAAQRPAQMSGNTETYTVNGLSSNTLYYFALKSKDDDGRWSKLSNVASARTLADKGHSVGTR